MKRRTLLLMRCWALLAVLPVCAAHAQGFGSVSGRTVPPAVTPTAPASTTATTVTEPAADARPFSSVNAPPGAPATAQGSGPLLPPVGDVADGSVEMADRVVIEKGSRRLYLMKGDQPIAEYAVRLGLNPFGHKQREGDFRTPEGRYHLSRRNPRSEFFLSLEVSYPNEADRARARAAGVRPGGLIMIHGQPNVPRKPPEYYASRDWTDGCIAVSNSDMVDIWLRTRLGIPIEIRP
jgi:hypothetical protein